MTTQRNTTVSFQSGALWASAFVIAALIILQAGRLPGNPAYAETAVNADEFTLVTANSGRGGKADPNEVLYILDGRGELLLMYEIEDVQKKQIFLRHGASLPTWFANAR
ncbi:MAG: hypothetical protein GY715_04490 [Planctomycetes bacterium]|nr:hypothetical protein [Planctomycetota bacterium]